MLQELRVENLGIFDEATVIFGNGMTAITGETGAGKTLLVEGLELLLGGRSSGSLVRDGCEEARVDGRFANGNEEVILSRVVQANGRTRAYIDGRPVTISQLAELGETLVNLHGQHDVLTLTKPAAQRKVVDAAAGPEGETTLSAYRDMRSRLQNIDAQIQELGGDFKQRARDIELLRYQVEEISKANITHVHEDEELREEEELLADAEAHQMAAEEAFHILEDVGIQAVGQATAALDNRAPFAELSERLKVFQDELAVLERELRSYSETIVSNPERLLEVQDRRRFLGDLRRKYGDTLKEVEDFGSRAAKQLHALEHYEEQAQQLEKEREECLAELQHLAKQLSRIRRQIAPELAAGVTLRLHELALPNATLRVEISEAEYSEDGADNVVFMFAANPGEEARPLGKVASGGELSRTMLALHLAAKNSNTPSETFIFDEIDSGIGGEAGIAVGRSLSQLAGANQVFCVTHLPQVAAFADTQLVVTKKQVKDRTVASTELVLDEARTSELSRMLAGVDSKNAKMHAAELLALAADERIHQ